MGCSGSHPENAGPRLTSKPEAPELPLLEIVSKVYTNILFLLQLVGASSPKPQAVGCSGCQKGMSPSSMLDTLRSGSMKVSDCRLALWKSRHLQARAGVRTWFHRQSAHELACWAQGTNHAAGN